jgi:hypothetical protein
MIVPPLDLTRRLISVEVACSCKEMRSYSLQLVAPLGMESRSKAKTVKILFLSLGIYTLLQEPEQRGLRASRGNQTPQIPMAAKTGLMPLSTVLKTTTLPSLSSSMDSVSQINHI